MMIGRIGSSFLFLLSAIESNLKMSISISTEDRILIDYKKKFRCVTNPDQ